MCVCYFRIPFVRPKLRVFFSEFLNRHLSRLYGEQIPNHHLKWFTNVYNLLLETGSGHIHVHPIPQNMEHLDGFLMALLTGLVRITEGALIILGISYIGFSGWKSINPSAPNIVFQELFRI